jgi:hypothetical protein
MRKTALFWGLGLMLLAVWGVLAQGATVTLTPTSAARNQSFTINAQGLQPSTNYRIDILFVGSGQVVYSTNRTADANGNFSIGIRTEASDALGEYRIQVRQGNSLVGEATFTLLDDAQAQPTNTPPPPTVVVPMVTATPAPSLPTFTPSPSSTRRVDVRVIPNSGVPRSTFNVLVSGLNPSEVVFVVVVYQGDGAVEYNRQWVANESGSLTVELFTTANNLPGEYIVRVEDTTRQTIAQNTFTIEGADVNAELTLSPIAGTTSTIFTLTINGARPFRDVQLRLTDPNTNTNVYEGVVRTNVDGTATTTFSVADGTPDGTYTLIATEGGTEIARLAVMIGANAFDPSAVVLRVVPPSGETGRVVTVSANRLPANVPVVIDILADGAPFKRFEVTTNGGGAVSVTFTTTASDPIGNYSAQLSLNGQLVQEASFTVLEARVPVLLIAPTEGSIGTAHTVTLSGLRPDEEVTFEVVFEDSVIFTSTKTADGNGVALLILVTDASDAPGTYTVRAKDVGGQVVVGDAQFVVTDTNVAQPPASTPTPAPSVTETPIPSSATASGNVRDVIEARLSISQPSFDYTFTGKAGEIISIALESADFDAYLNVYDSDGNLLTTADDAGDSLDAVLGVFILPYSGSYRVEATSYENVYGYSEGLAGAFTLTVTRVISVPIAYNTPISATMTQDTPAYYYTLEARAGDVFSVEVTGDRQVDTTLAIYDASGFQLAFDDDGGIGYHPEIARFVAPSDGNYLFVLTALAGSVDGTVTMNVLRGEPNRLDTPRTLALGGKQTNDIMIFDAEAGQVIELTLTVKSGKVSSFDVSAVQNDITLMTYSTAYGMASTQVLSFVAPETGAVIIQLNNYGGGISLEVQAR